MDHILQLHVEHHHHYCSLKHSDSGVTRFRKTVDDASQQVIVLAFAAMASLALLFLPSLSISMGGPLSPWLVAVGSCLLSTKTALFVLSNAIFALLAADCRWFFATDTASASSGAGGVSACEPGDVLEKRGRHGHEDLQRCAVQSCVPVSNQGCCLQNKNRCTASEAFTEPVIVSDSTTALEALKEQEEDMPVSSGPELLVLDEGDNGVAIELGTDAVEEPTCEIAGGLDELEIDELNKKFDEFIESRRSKWIKEETLLAVAPCLTC